jgi:hypothetical protein
MLKYPRHHNPDVAFGEGVAFPCSPPIIAVAIPQGFKSSAVAYRIGGVVRGAALSQPCQSLPSPFGPGQWCSTCSVPAVVWLPIVAAT